MWSSRCYARAIAGSIVAIALALLTGACGSTAHHDSTPPGPKDGVQAAFRFATCMRNHGVTNFPDPQVSSSSSGASSGGSVAIRMVAPATFAKAPHFVAASKACRGILAAIGPPDPATVAAQQQKRKQDLLAFARCLRTHGVPNFPDPTAQGQLTLAMIHSAGVDLQAPAVRPAARACVSVTNGAITWADVERALSRAQ